ncbi:MAG: hypothetical protein KF847_03955 [Pirellulales bacterium]|nr:hypothetical protein [Pirellulales bacterium]
MSMKNGCRLHEDSAKISALRIGAMACGVPKKAPGPAILDALSNESDCDAKSARVGKILPHAQVRKCEGDSPCPPWERGNRVPWSPIAAADRQSMRCVAPGAATHIQYLRS